MALNRAWYHIKRNFISATFPIISFSTIYADYTHTLNWKKTQNTKA
jgi:hypothetical protein